MRHASRLASLWLLLWLSPPGMADAFADSGETGPAWWSQVLKIVVTRADGMRELGSAVRLGDDRLVTNCHVLRGAERIEIESAGATYEARADQRDAYRDLCFIRASGMRAAPTPMIELGETRVGLEVTAVGYPAGDFTASHGRIIGLHSCACDDGKIIQTSAPFDRGASGGGLFDRHGRLVGILTFKARAGGNFHFALPVGWLRHLAAHPRASDTRDASFWERPGKESGYFLVACDLGAKQDWRGLRRLAREWTRQEPDNPEAWMALGRASHGLGQAETAASAFHTALQLDSTHSEAKWALQRLAFELGRDIPGPGGL